MTCLFKCTIHGCFVSEIQSSRDSREPFDAISGALLKYFGASSATGQDELPSTSTATQASSEMVSVPQDEELPSTSTATQASSEMVSTLEEQPPSMSSATVSPQQEEPSGGFLQVCVFVFLQTF